MTEGQTAYPVRVDASLDTRVSRGLWLVKWLLLVPHLIVLAFLWIAFWVVSVIAFFAILITGRYPRALFDFNVGVLRWSWRVEYYGYAALGTDRYPPFTLADVPDYPAHLDVAYPERLSRGLVLVKWWLLAIPQYVVVAVFAGGGLWFTSWARAERVGGWGLGGLIGLLVLVAAVVLLFTGRYPRQVYDFVLGMDRWVVRVVAYASLMTDRYPPFRLDMGGTDPGSQPLGPPPVPAGPGQAAVPSGSGSTAWTGGTASATGPASTAPGSRWTAGRVVSLVIGAVLLLASTGPLFGGGALLWADRTQRDGSWLTSPQVTTSTAGYALVSDNVQLDTAGAHWVLDQFLGRVRLQATARNGSPVFVGVAPTSAAAGYLDGVGRTVIRGVGYQSDSGYRDGGGTGYRIDPGMLSQRAGGPPATAPADAGIWTASVQGTGTQTLEWDPTDGNWTVVVMPTDRSAGLTVALAAAATVPGLTGLAVGLLVLGVVLLAVGVLLIVLAVHRAQSRYTPPPAGEPARPTGPAPDTGGAPTAPAPTAPAPRAPSPDQPVSPSSSDR